MEEEVADRPPIPKRAKFKRDASKWWEEVDLVGPPPTTGGARKWCCRFCKKKTTCGTDRVRAHLIGKGKGSYGCPLIDDANKERLESFANCLDGVKDQRQQRLKEARNAAALVSPPPSSSSRQFPSSGGSTLGICEPPSSGPLGKRSSSSRGELDSYFHPPVAKKRQSNIHNAFDAQRKERVWRAIARHFIYDKIPFHVIRSNYFKYMLAEVGGYGPHLELPSYEDLRTTLIAREKKEVTMSLELLRDHWKQWGVTLVVDGWSDTQGRHIHGMIAYSRGRSYFLNSHDISLDGKYATNLARIWKEGILYIGKENVIQVICDGEQANRKAGAMIEKEFPHIHFSPCMAHCINNVLKDFAKLPYFANAIEKGNKLVTFIKNHSHVNALMKNFSFKKVLKYSDTRFGYNFIMLDRLHELLDPLQQMFVSPDFKKLKKSRSKASKLCHQILFDDSFWSNLECILSIVKPLNLMLRLVDSPFPCIGKVYEGMETLVAHIKELKIEEDIRNELLTFVNDRWTEYHSPLHAVAYILDPKFEGKGQERERLVIQGWEDALKIIVPDSDERRMVKNQLSHYRSRTRLFNSEDAQMDRYRVNSALWWEDYGSVTKELQYLAIRILCQGASSSSIERLFSHMGSVATKKRNKLGTQKTNDLTFVGANMRLIEFCSKLDFSNEKFIGVHKEETIPAACEDDEDQAHGDDNDNDAEPCEGDEEEIDVEEGNVDEGNDDNLDVHFTTAEIGIVLVKNY